MASGDEQLAQALALHQSGELAAAEAIYRALLAQRSDNSDASHYLGLAAYQQGRFDEADALMTRAIGADPNDAAIFSNRGAVRLAQERFEDAVQDFDRAVALDPARIEALSNKALALTALGAWQDALAHLDSVLARGLASAQLHYNRGSLLLMLRRPQEAISALDAAIALAPDYPDALFKRGGALLDLQRPSEALNDLRAVLRLQPDHAPARFTAALCDLSEGNLTAGWPAYELRWEMSAQHSRRTLAAPQWRGDSDLRGRTIFVHAEQGFGDTFQFSRYVPLLAERGARVIFEVQPKTARLMTSLTGVETLIRAGESVPPCDLHCPLLGLPLAFDTTLETIPRQVPYLSAPRDEVASWAAAFPPAKGLRIGLAWSGRPQPNPHRTCPPQFLAPLFARGHTFVSLQNQYSAADREWLSRCSEVADVSDRLRDFAATAALIDALDLVITIDTAVAHLAGALGKPVWIMLPFIGPDWRWMLNRSDSPWYPTARLFRQPDADAWPAVIAAISEALDTYSPA